MNIYKIVIDLIKIFVIYSVDRIELMSMMNIRAEK